MGAVCYFLRSKSRVTYKKNDNNSDGKAIILNFGHKDNSASISFTREMPLSPSIANNFIIGVDADNDVIWVATSNGVSLWEFLK